jgi:CRISPR-associated endonuclease Cas2
MKSDSLASTILEGLWEIGGDLLFALPRPLESKYTWAYRLRHANLNSYQHAVSRLRNNGYIQIVKKNNQKFLRLTQSGELSILMQKAKIHKEKIWDRKWRILVFDIPENSKEKRALLRYLLKRNNFFKLQASVYITPYSFNREAIIYLKNSGLMDYIRILRVDEIDDDRSLKKYFGLK